MGLKAIRSAIWRVAALSAERPGPAGLMILAFSGCGRNYAGSRPASIKIRVTARPGGNREEATMRLTWRDGSATLLVAAAAAVYALWATGTAMATTSATVIAAVLFGLGSLPHRSARDGDRVRRGPAASATAAGLRRADVGHRRDDTRRRNRRPGDRHRHHAGHSAGRTDHTVDAGHHPAHPGHTRGQGRKRAGTTPSGRREGIADRLRSCLRQGRHAGPVA